MPIWSPSLNSSPVSSVSLTNSFYLACKYVSFLSCFPVTLLLLQNSPILNFARISIFKFPPSLSPHGMIRQGNTNIYQACHSVVPSDKFICGQLTPDKLGPVCCVAQKGAAQLTVYQSPRTYVLQSLRTGLDDECSLLSPNPLELQLCTLLKKGKIRRDWVQSHL